jgi:hypothetical protein
MDTTLVTVTLLSMAMAASLSVIVWRMLRAERERSEARVIALTTMAARSSNPAARASTPALRAAAPGPRAVPPAPRVSRPAPLDLDLELEIRQVPASASVSATPMFAEPEVSSPWGRRVAVMAALGLVVASAILFALTASSKLAVRRGAASATAAQPGPGPVVAGLELLSLRDARQPESLTITGLVQNPRGGAPLSRVTVTAYAFDDKGAFLASGRALLDVTALAPGDESPFVVSVPVTETVARYRIGFRGEDGRVIAHVDKRQQAAVVALRPGSGLALREGLPGIQ